MRILAVFLCVFSLQTQAAIPVNGSFQAEKDCPAYLSKNNKTNPGGITVNSGQSYPLIEINKKNAPDWFRIAGINHEYSQRWLHADCGSATYDVNEGGGCDLSPGRADAYVLAVSWQPAFCETYGYDIGKPECLHLNRNSYTASHIALHGLWPNQDACGINYGYCGVKSKASHCDYPPVDLDKETGSQLGQFMPGYTYGSCLERHEWAKHGTCQTLSQNDYFAIAIRLVSELNHTPFADYLHEHVGESTTLSQLAALVELSFGRGAADKVYFGCKDGLLVDMFIELPAELTSSQSLLDLVARAGRQKQSWRCPQQVKISDFIGTES